MSTPEPFEITSLEDRVVATNGRLRVSCLEEDGRMFRRRAVSIGSYAPAFEAVVVDVAGVKIYVTNEDVIVTRKDMWP